MSTGTPLPPGGKLPPEPALLPQVIVYGHSWLFYWWPVWVVGYIMALITWLHPVRVVIGNTPELFSANRNLGVIYALLFIFMIIVTSSSIRGLISALVIVCLGFLALLFAYLGWWEGILDWFGSQSLSLNLGFYLFFSTALLIVWALTVFVIDHLSFWRIQTGQVTHEFVLGAVDKSYDTETMIFTKNQSDIFRHWILGLGSGDLHMTTMGGRGVEAKVSNVLFVGAKMAAIQQLIATKQVEETT